MGGASPPPSPEDSFTYIIWIWSSAFWIGAFASSGTSGSMWRAASMAFCASAGSFAPSTESFCPARFTSVATVCTKLFSIVEPAAAWFGQKDAQQVAVIRRVVADLNVPLDIRVDPTVRDADGLALSSRNVFLSPEERASALALPRALSAGAGADDPVGAARAILDAERGLAVEYVAVADFDVPTLVAAVRVGNTRLIDNARLNAASR